MSEPCPLAASSSVSRSVRSNERVRGGDAPPAAAAAAAAAAGGGAADEVPVPVPASERVMYEAMRACRLLMALPTSSILSSN